MNAERPRAGLPPLVNGDREADVADAHMPSAYLPEIRDLRAAPTVKRPLTVQPVDAPVSLYERLLDDLPTTAKIVEAIGAGRYGIRLVEGRDDVFRIDDGHGASAEVTRIVREPGVRVYLADGGMDAPLVPRIRAKALITLRFDPLGERTLTGGQIYARLEGRLLHAVVRAIVPLVHGLVDEKIRRLTEAALRGCRHAAGRA